MLRKLKIEALRGVTWAKAFAEIKDISKLAFPVLLANFFRIAVYVVNGLFLGRLTDVDLSSAALGDSWKTISLNFGIGVAMAMDTIVSQAFGAKNFRLIGITFQNALVVATFLSIPISLLWWFTEHILVLFQQDPMLSKGAALYNQLSIPGLIPALFYRTISQFLQNQRIMYPAVIAGGVGIALSIPLNYIFIFGLGSFAGMGLKGAAIAGSLTHTIMCTVLWTYVWCMNIQKATCEKCLWKEAFRWTHIKTYLKLGVPAALMLVFEVLGFEIVTLLVGIFKNSVTIAAHAICYNILTFIFILPLGFSVGSATRIGNLLGEGNTLAAQFSALIGSAAFGTVLFVIFILLVSLGKIIPRAYTSDADVLAMAAKLMPIAAGVTFFDGVQTMEGGVIRALGKQFWGSIVNFLGYYIFSLPIGAGLAFGAGMKGIGLWYGLLGGVVGASVGYTIVLFNTNWQKEAENAQKRVGRHQIIDPDPGFELDMMSDDDDMKDALIDLDEPVEGLDEKNMKEDTESDDIPLIRAH